MFVEESSGKAGGEIFERSRQLDEAGRLIGPTADDISRYCGSLVTVTRHNTDGSPVVMPGEALPYPASTGILSPHNDHYFSVRPVSDAHNHTPPSSIGPYGNDQYRLTIIDQVLDFE